MPRKEKIIQVERPNPNADDGSLIKVDFTASEWALINAYFEENLNQTRAYLKVHPIPSGISEEESRKKYDVARTSASKEFAKPNIKSEIRYRLQEATMSPLEILKRYTDIARGSMSSFVRVADDGFVYFDLSQPEAQANMHLIKKMETKRERKIEGTGENAEEWEGEWVKVELHDAPSALLQLGRHYSLFTDKTDLTSNGKPLSWKDFISSEDEEKKKE